MYCSPLFVTWHKQSSDGELHLRGCIGNFNPLPLHEGLQKYALIRYVESIYRESIRAKTRGNSALQDHRFSPITLKELPKLTCAVSLLTDFELAKDYLDWEVGIHGIWIEFNQINGKKETATYLPEVMLEQEWTKEEAIKSLLRKGGFRGAITKDYCLENIVLTRYQSQKLEMAYHQRDSN